MPDVTTGDESASDPSAPLPPRLARQKLAYAQDQLAFLEFARRARVRLGEDTRALDAEIAAGRNLVMRLSEWADARIEPRRKLPRAVRDNVAAPRRNFLLFLDECGSHPLNVPNDTKSG